MKTIGLIGGMSWESSKLYYEFLNTKAKEVLGGSHSAKCIMVSLDFADIERLTFKGDWNAIGELIKEAAQQLERAGAEVILLCTNTIHLVSHYISENVTIPFLHIATTTGDAIKRLGLKKVALLGTKFTMEKDFYTKTLTNHFGLDIIIPDTGSRQVVHDIIYNELVKGQFTKASKQKIIRIIKELQRQGAEGVILGCTELPILISESDIDIPTFDTGKIHAHEAIEWGLKHIKRDNKKQSIKFNNVLTMFFNRYINAMTNWLFFKSCQTSASHKDDVGRLIHK
ncbi:aspartate/glutamate racemase family protein [uncultured Psychroserpens sp.]|uniref:aspartate/glutamate racemase family protein n=1 Tax=uncultured Psychroserpens sp. TaxID=255436 RepID=UPI00262FC278|nr:aspartate/glutamate racemase family protein [uncultured Psychroserpens sp.]